MENQPAWSLRIRGDGADHAKVTTRHHQFTVGAPLSFDREYDRTTALEQALGALGADVVNGFTVLAGRERVAIEDVEATVHAELDNPLTYLGVVGERGNPGLTRVEVKVYASSPAPERAVREVWEEARRRSPLVNTFQACIDLELSLQLVV